MKTKQVLLSWSSGKDSAWALYRLRQLAEVEVVGLVTSFSQPQDRVAMHAVRHELVRRQAQAAGLPLLTLDLPSPCDNEIYDAIMAAFIARARDDGITHMAFGDLFLQDVRTYREQRLANSGLAPLFPLWGLSTVRLAEEMIESGLRALLTCVDSRLLDARHVGREFDLALLSELPPGVDPCGENGEFHSFAYAGPMFDREIDVAGGEIIERDGFVFHDFLPSPHHEG
jgi:uncharacterized protein (TIGR00290 family)